MKINVMQPVEVEVTHVRMILPVRYEEEDISNDFPGREGEKLKLTVEVDTGKIVGWPEGRAENCHMKVCDGGIYQLLDLDGKQITEYADYVPHGLIPGSFGDYVDLTIDVKGNITNWPKKPNFDAFYEED